MIVGLGGYCPAGLIVRDVEHAFRDAAIKVDKDHEMVGLPARIGNNYTILNLVLVSWISRLGQKGATTDKS